MTFERLTSIKKSSQIQFSLMEENRLDKLAEDTKTLFTRRNLYFLCSFKPTT